MINSFTPVWAAGNRTNGQIYSNAYEWVGENLRLTVIAVILALFLVLMVWGIYKLIRKKQKQKTVPIQLESAPIEKKKVKVTIVTPADTEMNTKDNYQIGRSIVKAAWIFSITAVICVLLILVNHQYRSSRYAPLDKLTYIDTWTGKCYYSDGRKIE